MNNRVSLLFKRKNDLFFIQAVDLDKIAEKNKMIYIEEDENTSVVPAKEFERFLNAEGKSIRSMAGLLNVESESLQHFLKNLKSIERAKK